MATINFVNNTLITGTTFNPGLEDVLLPGGTITKATASVFEITNNSGGAFNNFKIDLTSSGANFTYTGTTPTAGMIDGITVFAPNGTTHIIEVSAGAFGFGDKSLVNFFNRLTGPDGGAFDALQRLLSANNTVNGSNVADHATAFEFGDTVFGNGGNDIISSDHTSDTTLVGGPGNDTIRVGDGRYVVAGGDLSGSAAAGDIHNTLEIRGQFDDRPDASFDEITHIDALRFVDTKPPVAPNISAAELEVDLRSNQIGNGLVSLHLAVSGSSSGSPHSEDEIRISRDEDPTDTHPVNLDLSHWTFTNWDQHRSSVQIGTNEDVALNDNIVGTPVADFIETNAGNDTIRGGGGADFLEGDEGSDTFVYGLHEAAIGEEIAGDGFPSDSATDKVLILADNNFTGAVMFGIEQIVFGGTATATFDQNSIDSETFQNEVSIPNPLSTTIVGDGHVNKLAFVLRSLGNQPSALDLSTLKFQSWTNGTDQVSITGTKGHDDISGSIENDIIDGKGGSDFLQGNAGADTFLFDTAFGHGVAHVSDFTRGQDILELDDAVFTALKLGVLGKKAFGYGAHATGHKGHIIFDKDTGVVRYDDDGSGKHHAHIIAVLDDVSALKHGDLLVI